MNTKTIKLNKHEYTDFKEELTDYDVLILTGARGSGKSYPVAKHVSKILEENENAKFIYMRISDRELSTFASWCADLNLSKICGTPIYQLKRGKPTKGDILLQGMDEEGHIIYERVIGKCLSLESSHMFKSGKYDEFEAIVFEEYTQKNMNPNTEKNYVFNFLENVVTIFRDRRKRIYILGNNLKSIPLLDTAIDELTGEMFNNPLKIKIFRKVNLATKNNFLMYLNGELFDDENFKVNIDEFFIIYTNKKFIIYQHKIYPDKHYITANKINRKIIYKEIEYMTLKYFCQRSATNEFYYQNNAIEKTFTNEYHNIIAEIVKFVSDNGTKYVMKD